MAKEIERKFLISNSSYRELAVSSISIVQGYLSRRPEATVRVRISGERAWLTVKGINQGAVRNEWEYSIPVADATAMLGFGCEGEPVRKTRYFVPAGDGLRWEVDEFEGALRGLVVAEIELPSEDASFSLPSFIGREVTGDPRYYNSSLAEPGASLPPCS